MTIAVDLGRKATKQTKTRSLMVLNLVFCHTNLTLFSLLRIHVFCKASTERAKENTVLVSEIFIVYFFCVK